MITINCLLHRINYLPYYLPICIELCKRGINCNVFLEKASDKKDFIDPFNPNHLDEIMRYSKKYGYKVYVLSKYDLEKYDGRNISSKIIYLVAEGNIVGIKNKNNIPDWYNIIDKSNKSKLISLVVNYEFVMFIDKYIKYVDYVIFPTQKYIDYYLLNNMYNKKFIVSGSPKYDFKFHKNENLELSLESIHKKYLSKNKSKSELESELESESESESKNNKYILFIFPKDPDKHKKSNTIYPKFGDIIKLYQILRKLGYQIIVKNRPQDKLTLTSLKGDYYIEDIDYGIVNSLELIKICELGIFFSSSINEEFVALNKPYIDIKVDLVKDRFPFYNKEHNSKIIPYNFLFSRTDIQIEKIIKIIIEQLIGNKNNYLFPEQNELLNSSNNSTINICDKILSL
jgi:hypothetical protein